MKRTTLAVLAISILVSSSQTTLAHPHEKTVFERGGCWIHLHAKFDDARVGDILKLVSDVYGIGVAAELDVDLNQTVTISKGNVSWGQLLTEVLTPLDLTWDTQGNYVIVRRAGFDLVVPSN